MARADHSWSAARILHSTWQTLCGQTCILPWPPSKSDLTSQRILAAAVDAPVTVMDTAGEGGAWGMAVLAQYMIQRKDGETLPQYLDNRVFAGQSGTTVSPVPEDVEGFNSFIEMYKKGYPIEQAAVESM